LIARMRAWAGRLLGKSGPLVLSRLASAVLTFALPLYLVRLLSPQSFGVYKQFFLVAQTLLLVGQLGLTQSLYYFLPRGGAERGSYVTHALSAVALLGALSGVGLYFGAPRIAQLMDPALAGLRLPLALFAGAMLAAAPLEGALTSDGRIGGAAIAYLCSDVARVTALGGGALLGGARGLFWAAVGVGWLRVAALWILVARRALPFGRPRVALLRAQLAFALPFAGSIWLYVAQRYFAQYAVSARFSAASFALFAVASFHLPVVDIVYTPICEVLMVELGRALGDGSRRGRGSRAVRDWDGAVEKLASLLLPAAAGAWLFGPTVLPLIFTAKYAGAVPLFMLATLEIPLWILPCDALLRSAGDTRFLFAFNAVRVGLTAMCVLGGIHFGGLGGAIVGGLASEALSRALMLARGRRHLGVGLLQTIDGPVLSRIAFAAASACVPAALFLRAPVGVASRLLFGAGSYVGVYFLLRARLLRAPMPTFEGAVR
jgi:O-antigen/teichoic acid export membrane protein